MRSFKQMYREELLESTYSLRPKRRWMWMFQICSFLTVCLIYPFEILCCIFEKIVCEDDDA